jgi:single-strand DNA-binding protein
MSSRSVNHVTLIGHLGRDADTKFTQSGIAVTNFTLATSRRFKSGEEWKEETDWHNVVLWRQEAVGQYLTKGKQVYVSGRLQTRSYEKDGITRYATDVVADEVILLGSGGVANSPADRPSQAAVSTASARSKATVPDDDVPF